MLATILVLSSLFCSKGDNIISPIIPKGSQEEENIIQPREPEYVDYAIKANMAPFMPVEMADIFEKFLDFKIGNGFFPDQQMMFMGFNPMNQELTNPPVIQFAFVTSKDLILPEDIAVSLNNDDISDQVQYNVVYHPGRYADLYVGTFRQLNYMLSTIRYDFNVAVFPEKGDSISENLEFNVPQLNDLEITQVGFAGMEGNKIPIMSKMIVMTNLPDYIECDDWLLNPVSWTVSYKDEKPFPSISSIEKFVKNQNSILIIQLSSDVLPDENFSLSFSLGEDVRSDSFDAKTPDIPFDRGGGVYRQAADNPCDGCTGHFEDEVEIDMATGCEDTSWYFLHIDAPRVPEESLCETKYRQYMNTITCYYHDPHHYTSIFMQSDDGLPMSYISFLNDPYYYCEGDCVTGDCISSISSISAIWEIAGYIYPDGPDCSMPEKWKTVSIPRYDSEVPTVEAEIYESIHTQSGFPPCATGCEESDCHRYKNYYISIDITDNECLGYPSFKTYIYYSNGRIVDFTNLWEIIWPFPDGPKHRNIQIWVDPNVFQCATRMKILAFDKSGNWGSDTILDSSHQPPPDPPLPYPSTVTMNFGLRSTSKQYINLDRKIDTTTDTQICYPAPIVPAEHGNQIYIEITVNPPIDGIKLQLHYEDPSFNKGDNHEPTNIKNIDDQDRDYSEENNPDLLNKEYQLLWGSHPAHGHDRVTYGDNYNYYPGYNDYINDIIPTVPQDDPIRQYDESQFPRSQPYFINGWPWGQPETPFIVLTTNIHGKTAALFNTRGHGGDNFRFKVYKKLYLKQWVGTDPWEECLDCEEDCSNCEDCGEPCAKCEDCEFCLKSEKSYIFTNYRKIKVWYGWMEDRGNYFPGCENASGVEQAEYKGAHTIGESESDLFYFIEGVFDDCFIEIEREIPSLVPPYKLENTAYKQFMTSFDDLLDYGNEKTGFNRFAGPDTVALLGADHILDVCINERIGTTQNPESFPDDYPPSNQLYSYVWVGNIYDKINTVYEVYLPYIDDDLILPADWKKLTQAVAAHELGHLIYCDFPWPGWLHDCPYGLMVTSPDKDNSMRSYLYADQIRLFRTKLSHFDTLDY